MFSDPVNGLSEAQSNQPQSESRNKNNLLEGFLPLVDDFEVGPSPFIFKLDEHCSVIRLEPLTLSTRMSAHLETHINITRYIFADSIKYENIGRFHEI